MPAGTPTSTHSARPPCSGQPWSLKYQPDSRADHAAGEQEPQPGAHAALAPEVDVGPEDPEQPVEQARDDEHEQRRAVDGDPVSLDRAPYEDVHEVQRRARG